MRLLEPEFYQFDANAIFEKIAAQLRSALPEATIEHIGSSAMPGVISKGDLDVFVGVDADQFASAVKSIGQLGFRVKEDTLRTDQLCPFEGFGFPLDVGIQLVELGSRFESFRRFRELLTSNLYLRDRYNQVKRAAAPLDENSYRAAKQKFIQEVLCDAKISRM